jgi:hypothetical protein
MATGTALVAGAAGIIGNAVRELEGDDWKVRGQARASLRPPRWVSVRTARRV